MNSSKFNPIPILVGVGIVMIVGLYSLSREDRELFDSVKSGQATLECELQKGVTTIHPDKITQFSDGRWYFTNGSATQCRVSPNM